MYACIPVKRKAKNIDNDILAQNFNEYCEHSITHSLRSWSENLSEIRGYIDQRESVDFRVMEVNNFDELYMVMHGSINSVYNPSNLTDFEISVFSTDTIHPYNVYVTNNQIAEFELVSSETNALEDDIDAFSKSLCRLTLLSKYLYNLDNDDFKCTMTSLFCKCIMLYIANSGYDFYIDEEDDDDIAYQNYKRFSEKIGADLSCSSIYEMVDEFARYHICVDLNNGGVI